MNDWLGHYEYRTNISWELIASVVIASLVLTLLTVSFQALKAGLINPVKNLRSE